MRMRFAVPEAVDLDFVIREQTSSAVTASPTGIPEHASLSYLLSIATISE
jgi:hypothetical protein